MDEQLFTIKAKISYDPEFLSLCLLRLYDQQEKDEQAVGVTHHDNGAGFNKSDSINLSRYADILMRGLTLTDQQHADAARRLIKYSRQLLNLLSDDEIE